MTSPLPSKYMSHGVPPEVQAIMAERGVTQRRAYHILRLRKMADTDPFVPSAQRIAVLGSLIESGARNVDALCEDLHRKGSKIDRHDAAKTLWRLQKAGFVSFREGTRGLYAIRVTDDGLAAYSATRRPEVVDEPAVEANPIYEEPIYEEPVETPGPTIGPLLRDLLERATKVSRLYAAAQMLEAAGEDDMAVVVYDKAKLTPLEDEVIVLLRSIGL